MEKDIFKFKPEGITKTKFASYCICDVPEGCKSCIRGEKLVLFITGICRTGCIYCPLSDLRKGSDKMWANERECKDIKDVLEEAKESNAKGAGITGGDPLVVLDKTVSYARALKKEFGNDFHIHIYLSTKLVTRENLAKLAEVVDEVRFHPVSLNSLGNHTEDLEKIGYAKEYFKKENIGIEIPLFPDKRRQALEFIKKAAHLISFVNLNELEIGDTNFDYITQNYNLNSGGYTIKGSMNAGIWMMNQILKEKISLKVHLCTAETKNWHQFKNRLLKHDILPFGERTEEGMVIYYYISKEKNQKFKELVKGIDNKEAFFDSKKQRVIIDERVVKKYSRNWIITKSEEYPTFDGIEAESEDINRINQEHHPKAEEVGFH
jgi:uncharacterized protein